MSRNFRLQVSAFGAILILASASLRALAAPDDEPEDGAGRIDAILDSLSSESDSLFVRWRDAAPPAWVDPDSAEWIPSATPARDSSIGWKRTQLSVSPVLGFSKVDGISSGGSVAVRWLRGPGLALRGSVDRAYWRGDYEGDLSVAITDRPRGTHPFPTALRTRITGGGKEGTGAPLAELQRRSVWSLRVGYSRRTLAFGTNRPVLNSLPAFILGVDHQSYLDREERFVGLELQPARAFVIEGWCVDRRDRSLTSTLDPLFRTDPGTWENPRVDNGPSRGAIVRTGWSDQEFGKPMRSAAIMGSAFGGVFGKEREYYTLGVELNSAIRAPSLESVELGFAAAAAGGSVPVQGRPDLGGSSTLRGYEPRALVGATSLFARMDLVSAFDPLRRTGISLLRSLRLQPVLFADIGAVWGGSGWSSIGAITLPVSSDWRSDAGIGIQRNINYPGLLSRVRLDFAWRTDRSHDRLRASIALLR